MQFIKELWKDKKRPSIHAFDLRKYVGPGLLVTVGFVDPGNWASNLAAGSQFGYQLLWVVTLSTIMLILLQHNAAHLGIVTGKCLSEAATAFMKPWVKNIVLGTAVLAAISTALAEILGGAIALQMLFKIPLRIGSLIMVVLTLYLQFGHFYKKVEKIIISFVTLISVAFMVEVGIIPVSWESAAVGWVYPAIPDNAMPIIMAVLGAVIMPHNLFLHSEVIQSQHFNTQGEATIENKLKTEYVDTIFSMCVGWAINSAIIFVAATAFYANGIAVTDLAQAGDLLTPILGSMSALIFSIALLFAGISSSLTSAMAGGCIFAGMLGEPYDTTDRHTRFGSCLTMIAAYLIILVIEHPFSGLIYSQVFLSMQLPLTIFTQLYLTSSKRVMGKYANKSYTQVALWTIGIIVTGLNVYLLYDAFMG